jgi:hypothetical protein
MAVESAADLAGLFELDEFAEAAEYQSPVPGTAPVACAVIVDRGQARERFRGGDQQAEASERSLRVPASAMLGAVMRDGLFTMLDAAGVPTGEVFRVRGLPKLDETASVWSVDLVMVD